MAPPYTLYTDSYNFIEADRRKCLFHDPQSLDRIEQSGVNREYEANSVEIRLKLGERGQWDASAPNGGA